MAPAWRVFQKVCGLLARPGTPKNKTCSNRSVGIPPSVLHPAHGLGFRNLLRNFLGMLALRFPGRPSDYQIQLWIAAAHKNHFPCARRAPRKQKGHSCGWGEIGWPIPGERCVRQYVRRKPVGRSRRRQLGWTRWPWLRVSHSGKLSDGFGHGN